MNLNYQLLTEDYREFVSHASRKILSASGKAKLLYVVNMAVYVFLGLGGASLYHAFRATDDPPTHLHLIISGLSFLLWGIGLFAYSYYHNRIFRKWALLPNGSFLQPKNIELTPEEIRVVSQDSESRYKWNSIIESSETKNLLCLWLDRSIAITVPKRAFESSESLQTFRNWLLEKVESPEINEGAMN